MQVIFYLSISPRTEDTDEYTEDISASPGFSHEEEFQIDTLMQGISFRAHGGGRFTCATAIDEIEGAEEDNDQLTQKVPLFLFSPEIDTLTVFQVQIWYQSDDSESDIELPAHQRVRKEEEKIVQQVGEPLIISYRKRFDAQEERPSFDMAKASLAQVYFSDMQLVKSLILRCIREL